MSIENLGQQVSSTSLPPDAKSNLTNHKNSLIFSEKDSAKLVQEDDAKCFIDGKPVETSTLKDISQLLNDQNSKLERKMAIAEEASKSLIRDLDLMLK